MELKHVEPKHFWESGTLKQHQAVQFMPYNKAVSKYGIRIIKKNNIHLESETPTEKYLLKAKLGVTLI